MVTAVATQLHAYLARMELVVLAASVCDLKVALQEHALARATPGERGYAVSMNDAAQDEKYYDQGCLFHQNGCKGTTFLPNMQIFHINRK